MVAIDEGSIRRFRCHTGHGFTADALAERGLPQVERTLWAAVAQLEEHETILRELEQSAKDREDSPAAAHYAARAGDAERFASMLRELAKDPALSRVRG
jgi:two-component system chemotaxis response regulator CheB